MANNYFDLLTLGRIMDNNPDYLRDTFRRAVFTSTYCTESAEPVRHGDYYVTDFVIPDSMRSFEKNLTNPTTKEQLVKYGWANEDGTIAKPITYKINDEGFRSPKFTHGDRPIVCFGCSYTYGVGLPEDFTWPYLVSKHYDIPVYNLGLPGNGLDMISVYTAKWLADEIWRPRAFCILLPPPGRMEILQPASVDMPPPVLHSIKNLLHLITEEKPSKLSEQLINAIPMTSYLNQLKNLELIKLKGQSMGIPVVWGDSQNCTPPPSPEDTEVHYARDLAHHGLQWQTAVADYMIKKLDTIPQNNGKDWHAYS